MALLKLLSSLRSDKICQISTDVFGLSNINYFAYQSTVIDVTDYIKGVFVEGMEFPGELADKTDIKLNCQIVDIFIFDTNINGLIPIDPS